MIIGSVSSMFAVMINSNNGIIRILNTMGREKLLPSVLGRIDPRRRTPVQAIAFVSVFSIASAILVGLFSGGLGSPTGGSNVYGYLGFALTVAILPVYALSNLAVIKYFYKRPDFNLVRHVVLPLAGAGLMIALLVGQIIENQVAPYSWVPWFIVGWLVVVIAVAIWLGSNRPEVLARAGSIMATGELEEARALHGDPE